jgi:putative oxygen-independent coproporphyrinogen III oxidase
MSSLYIHFPWCVKKCPYCDFNSHSLKESLPEKDYINALILNLKQSQEIIQGMSLKTIFMGGGTPSLFSPDAIHSLLQSIQEIIPFEKNIEITLEANPGTVEQSRFKGYFDAGINRISLGVQSLHDHHLQALGRIHSANQAKQAVEAVKAAGFQHLNIDIMYGLPEQTIEQGLQDLSDAIALAPTHFSWYELTIEPNTYFWHHPPKVTEEEDVITLHAMGQSYLREQGFSQYEVSAYYQKEPCRHNLNYWEFGDYLAIGAGSHAKISCVEQQQIMRYHHFRSPKQYMDLNQGFVQAKQLVPSDQLAFEFMLNALRLTHGVPVKYFSERTGLPLEAIEPMLNEARMKGWLKHDPDRLCATPEGARFLNDLVSLFLYAN